MLVRDFIHKSLYNQQNGYFSSGEPIIEPSVRLHFKQMIGRDDYEKSIAKLYSNNNNKSRSSSHWLTPVEIFQPYYSQAICRWMTSSFKSKPLVIYEVGGGNGTNALHILDFIKLQRPDLYKTVKYNLVEISPTLASKQRVLLQPHAEKVHVINADFLSWKQHEKDPCVVMALEVLDNLPHDKLISDGSRDFTNWKQVSISLDDAGKFLEHEEPLKDDLALEAAKFFCIPPAEKKLPFTWRPSELFQRAISARVKEKRRRFEMSKNPQRQAVFVPSGAIKMMRNLRDYFPNHRLILADFDFLPLGDVNEQSEDLLGSLRGCMNSPIVASPLRDHGTYLAEESADIMFQTNFDALKNAWEHIVQRKSSSQPQIWSSQGFFTRYAKLEETETRNGFNPLLEDFVNTSVLTVDDFQK